MKTLLINPSRRRKRRKTAKKTRRAAPRRRRASAPVRRRRRSRAVATRRRRLKPYGRVIRVRRVRRNPIAGLRGAVLGQLVPAATGAAGALALDVTMGYVGGYLPDALKTGPVMYVTKAAIAIGLGMVATRFGVRSEYAKNATLGALTVVLHDAAKDVVATNFPGVPMGEYVSGMGFANAGAPISLGYDQGAGPAGIGEYVSGMSDYVASDGGWNG